MGYCNWKSQKNYYPLPLIILRVQVLLETIVPILFISPRYDNERRVLEDTQRKSNFNTYSFLFSS